MFFRTLKRVEALVALYESTKKNEHDRRATYKNDKIQLEEEISELAARLQSSDLDTVDAEKLKQVNEQYQLVADRLQNQRLILVIREASPFREYHEGCLMCSLGEESA